MLRGLLHLILLVLISGCLSGGDSVSRSEGPLGEDDLPNRYSEQVTTMAVRGDEGEWHETEHRYATLDESGKPLEVVFIMEHPTRAFDTALTYEYDDLGRKRFERTWHWKEDTGWTEIARVETFHDEEGRPTEERASSRDAGGWIDARLVQYSYSRTSGAITRIVSVADESTMWRNDLMEERFMSEGRVDSVRTYSWVDGRWLDGHRTTFSYGEDGEADDPEETVMYRRGTRAWVPFMRTTHTETDAGEHETFIHHRRGSEWIVTRREVTREKE